MSKIHAYAISLNRSLNQFSRYFGVALIGLGFDFGTLILLRELFGVHYLLATAGGFIVGLIVNFLLSERFVFKDPKIASKTANFMLFGLIGLIGLGMLSGIMWILTGLLGLNYVFSKVIATAFVYMWNFLARKTLYRS